jgi:lipopolysaccharide transport system ATP-binding protein
MSDDVVIRAEGLGKKYVIGHAAVRERYVALRDLLARGAYNLWRKTASMASDRAILTGNTVEEFWALKDVSFEVKRGEVLGIIGRNGAGKSTLLKILSRVTEPSEGQVTVDGRVASLLEVGTGFHPELTGRENIYLNGAILGMGRAEIRRKFDEIVAFAEVEKFLDTPVKRYSSGMYVRLAFAVAAHLEPEILIVDEVLAVGDAAFQRKCLGKMGELVGHRRTVLLVSHNLTAVQSLCARSILLSYGRVAKTGATQDVIRRYLETDLIESTVTVADRRDRTGDGAITFRSITVENADGSNVIFVGCRIRFILEYRGSEPLRNSQFLIAVYDVGGTGLFLLDSNAREGFPEVLPAAGFVTCTTDPVMLTPGRCNVNVALLRGGVKEDHVQQAAIFDLQPSCVAEFRTLPERDWVMCVLGQQWAAAGQADYAASELGRPAIASSGHEPEGVLKI